jgi:hypothetical protein
VGGALLHLQQLQHAFQTTLRQRLPQATLQAPAGDACSGALSLAAAAIKQR